MKRRLIVGLGNPGSRYTGTWHNLGVEVVMGIAKRWSLEFSTGKGDYYYADRPTSCEKITLMRPTSYMNLSGMPVSNWLKYYGVTPEDMIVVYDDHDLPLGRIRLRSSGSSGGHRGLSDIIQKTGSDDIPRVRIGIHLHSSGERRELSRQVLSKIPARLREDVDYIVARTVDAVEMILDKGFTRTMNEFNGISLLD